MWPGLALASTAFKWDAKNILRGDSRAEEYLTRSLYDDENKDAAVARIYSPIAIKLKSNCPVIDLTPPSNCPVNYL